MKRTFRAGTTLVELLVVIVVFLIGILAILQIFPGGFNVLRTTRNNHVARELARAQIEQIKSRPDILAEMILPVHYVLGAGTVNIVADTSFGSDFLGLDFNTESIDPNGDVIRNGTDNIGRWDHLTGANRIRRVIAEGGRVPAPRLVGSDPVQDFGGLMLLQFAPIAYDPAYPTLLQVYGNDMVRRFGSPGFRVRPWEYYVEEPEEPGAQLYLPQGPTQRLYRLAMSAWIFDGANTFRRSIVDATITVAPGAGFAQFPLANYAGLQPGESFVGAEWESIRVARVFVPVATFTNGEPYEYKILDSRLGVLLFNRAGYNFQEVRQGRRVPLVALVNYDVYDWRIIRDEFRIASTVPVQQRLQLNNIRVKGTTRADSTTYPGMNILVQDGAGNVDTRDFLLLDMETGGVYTPDSLTIDKSVGLVTYVDTDGGTPGLQMRMVLPGQTNWTQVNASGRAVRALYQCNLEWSVQAMVAPSIFTLTYSPPSVGQYYVGGSSGAGGSLTRVYFPVIDVGRKVVIGEIWYRDSGGTLRVMNDQDFVIQNAPSDPLGAYIDITNVDPSAQAFDFTANGYAVRRVKGASIAVRVLWNPEYWHLTPDQPVNNQRFDAWTRSWRRTTIETFLQREEN